LPTGQIDPREEDRLNKMGGWLAKNGESIYGTQGGPFMPDSIRVSTYKGNRVFIHLFDLKKDSLCLPGIKETILKACLLNGPDIIFSQKSNLITLHLPREAGNAPVKIISLTLDKVLDEQQVPIR
jgi:alpha-L-fucosidase